MNSTLAEVFYMNPLISFSSNFFFLREEGKKIGLLEYKTDKSLAWTVHSSNGMWTLHDKHA